MSEGIFSVGFLKGKDVAYIGTNQDRFFNLANENFKSVWSGFDPTDDNNLETCNKNSSWGFNRYPWY